MIVGSEIAQTGSALSAHAVAATAAAILRKLPQNSAATRSRRIGTTVPDRFTLRVTAWSRSWRAADHRISPRCQRHAFRRSILIAFLDLNPNVPGDAGRRGGKLLLAHEVLPPLR